MVRRPAIVNRVAAAFDRLVGLADPVVALRRMRARVMMAQATMFLGGGYSGARSDRPALKNWNPLAGSADQDTLGDLATLRARSRDAVRNQPLATGAISTNVSNVIGTGLKPKSQIDRDLLGLSDDDAEEWQREAERLFAYHSGHLDIEGELSFATLQGLILRATLESGDVLVVRRFVARGDDLLSTRMQLIEADRISTPRGKIEGQGIAAGVEINQYGQAVAYHISDTHPGDLFMGPTNWERIVVHGAAGRLCKLLYTKERPGQRRGVPLLAPVLEQLKQLRRYSEAELAATVVSALFTVFVKHEGGGDPASGLNGFVGASGAVENKNASGWTAPERELHLGQGLVFDLDEGESIESANPSRPNAAFDPFWVAMVREIGIAIDMPFEILVKHFQSSYSASRAAFLMAWKVFKNRRIWMATGPCRMAWEWTISEAVASGMLDAPGFFTDPVVRDAWLAASWTGDAPGQIDEMNETQAAELRIKIGVSTEQEETIKLTGGDWERNLRQRKRELTARRDAGVMPPEDIVPAPGPAAPPPPAAGYNKNDDADAKERAEHRAALTAALQGAAA